LSMEVEAVDIPGITPVPVVALEARPRQVK
jgi:hypothetical protein